MVDSHPYISDKSVVILDLHGTLTPIMSIWQYTLEGFSLWSDYLYLLTGLRSGELTYRYCCETITRDLKGTHIEDIKKIMSNLPLADGVVEFVEILKERDISVWMLTSGLGHMGEVLQERMPVDRIIGNWYDVDSKGELTGELTFNVDMGKKGEVLRNILLTENINGNDCFALGDTKSDIEVFEMVGFSIAVSPKDDSLREIADITIELDEFIKLPSLLGLV